MAQLYHDQKQQNLHVTLLPGLEQLIVVLSK
jgi:hypothetical protein